MAKGKKPNFIIKVLLILGITCFYGASVSLAFEHPSMFLNKQEIAAIKAKLGQEPWKTAYAKMMSEANQYLTSGTVNVMGGKLSPSGDPHEYFTEQYYSSNPDRIDQKASSKLGKAVRSLGLAYAFTGQEKYADKVIKFIYDWCLNPNTYMKPDKLGVTGNAQPVLDVSFTIPNMYFGADLIWNYPGWKAADKAAFQQWVKTLANTKYPVKSPSCQNNWQDWNHLMRAASMVITESNAHLQLLFDGIKPLLQCKMNDQGKMEYEYSRSTGIGYTLFSIVPLMLVMEVARHHGEDLYNYSNGSKNIKLALDYIEPYVKNPSTWPWQQSYKGGNRGAFELGNLAWPKQAYVDRLKQWGRPYTDARIIGHITLTHAAGARLWKVYKSSTPTQGNPTIVEAEAMTLNGYILDNGQHLLGTAILVDPNGSGAGTATTTFTGASGSYTIEFYAIPENDGTPTVKLFINSQQVLNETYQSNSNWFNLAHREIYTITGISVNQGDIIRIEGTAESAAFARVDKIAHPSQPSPPSPIINLEQQRRLQASWQIPLSISQQSILPYLNQDM